MNHPFPFDPTYGYDLPRLLAVPAPAEPADFAAFWRQTYAENQQIPVQLATREVDQGTAATRVFEVEFTSWGNFRTGGWITLPRDGRIERGFVVGHGYGGRAAPDLEPPASHAAAIYPCARGFDRSARPDLPNTAAWHVLHGLSSRDTYIHRGCVAELWSAATALLEFVPQIDSKLDYFGVSFGGGIGTMALAWDARFRRAYLEVPSFGNHPLRVTLPCTGSGEAVRIYHRHHPEALDVLAYYDSATAARYLRLPVLFSNALFDPAVPPPGQFAVHNAASGPKALYTRQAGHFEYPGQADDEARLRARRDEWFGC